MQGSTWLRARKSMRRHTWKQGLLKWHNAYKARTKNRRTKTKPKPMYTNSLPVVTGFPSTSQDLWMGRWMVCCIEVPSNWPQHIWQALFSSEPEPEQGKEQFPSKLRAAGRPINEQERCTQRISRLPGVPLLPRFTRGEQPEIQLLGHKGYSELDSSMCLTCDEIFLKRNRIFLRLSYKVTVKMQSNWLLMKSQSWDDLII